MMMMVQGHERGTNDETLFRCLCPRYVLFLYSRCVYYLLMLFLGITYEISMGRGTGRLEWAAIAKTGPNNACDVSFGPQVLFSFFFSSFFIC